MAKEHPAEAGQEVDTHLLAGISFLIHRKPLNPQALRSFHFDSRFVVAAPI
jgi:hypothetical protein